MKLIIFSLLLLSQQVYAAKKKKCYYTTTGSDITVKFTAFKTFMKLGVGGSFKKITLENKVKGKTIIKAATGIEAKIDTNSLDTGDEGRDVKIKKFFFSTMEDGPEIEAEIKKFDTNNDLLMLEIEINDEEMTIPLNYTIKNNKLVAKGIIDIFDWDLGDNLKSLNKACSEKHEKKTWNDVEIELTAKFKKICK